MRNYLPKRDKNSESTYITGVSISDERGPFLQYDDSDHYKVTFADGTEYTNVECSLTNRDNLEQRLEAQVHNGVEQRFLLVRKKVTGTIVRVGSMLSIAAVSSGYFALDDNFMSAAISGGVSCFCAAILGGCYMFGQHDLINELDDNDYRLKHHDEAMEYFKTSRNAYLCLEGDSEAEKKERAEKITDMMVDECRDPFSLVEMEIEEGLSNVEVHRLIAAKNREEAVGLYYDGGFSYSEHVASKVLDKTKKE